MLEIGKTYVTRNGQKAKVVYIGEDDSTKNVVVEVEGELKFYWDNGAFGNDHPLDIMPPVEYKLGQDIFDEEGDKWIVVSLNPPRAVCIKGLLSTLTLNNKFNGLYAHQIKNGYVGPYKIKD
jgi:hypothetical protein